MVYDGVSLMLAAHVDSRPLFWWIGLFTSEGGLLIVVFVLVIIALLVGALVTSRRRP